MDPTEKKLSKFYMTFKVHKPHQPMTAPPPRPIICGSGSITENIGAYVEYHIKDIANKHTSYLQDTPDFLRTINQINKGNKLPKNAILATIDAIGAYTNIPQEDGIQCIKEATEGSPKSDFIVRLMELLLKHNLFEFHSSTWRQEIGTAMGVKPAPSYANIYLANRIDERIFEIGNSKKSSILLYKRFLDDIFKIFQGTTKELHQLLDEINQIHPTLKFTMQHTSVDSEAESDRCGCKPQNWIPFLDTSCKIEDGQIEIDLFKKETDRNQYLLTSSCHPIGCTKKHSLLIGTQNS